MEETKDKLITVFTATYNRCQYISRLYDSLKKQTVKNFKWLIIDDGTDGTERLILSYQQVEKTFPILYLKDHTEERGINRAMNKAFEIVDTECFMKVDDDDYLTEDAIEMIEKWIETITSADKTRIAAVSGLRAYPDGRINGGRPKMRGRDHIDVSNFERRKYRLGGDKAEVYFTDILRRYGPLPEISGEISTYEGMLWNKIADAGFVVRWFDKVIYYTEYLPGGATKTGDERAKRDFQTFTLLTTEYVGYKKADKLGKIKALRRYFMIARKKDISFRCARQKFMDCDPFSLYVALLLSYVK